MRGQKDRICLHKPKFVEFSNVKICRESLGIPSLKRMPSGVQATGVAIILPCEVRNPEHDFWEDSATRPAIYRALLVAAMGGSKPQRVHLNGNSMNSGRYRTRERNLQHEGRRPKHSFNTDSCTNHERVGLEKEFPREGLDPRPSKCRRPKLVYAIEFSTSPVMYMS